MGQSYRIQTELGINKTINVQLDQEFEFLEILSLKIQQSDIYTRSCADYGVLVGRITANNGFGLPNARVSIFIPIETIDESNPIIQSIYPYKSRMKVVIVNQGKALFFLFVSFWNSELIDNTSACRQIKQKEKRTGSNKK